MAQSGRFRRAFSPINMRRSAFLVGGARSNRLSTKQAPERVASSFWGGPGRDVPSNGEALTPKRHSVAGLKSPRGRALYKSTTSWEIAFARSSFLVPNEGARKGQFSLRFFKVRLDAERLLVMSNC
jgi:hypothetical protein